MRKFGFKLFSTNIQATPDLVKECAEFARSKDDVFIEITALAESSKDDWLKIKNMLKGLEVRIHASYIGFDTGNIELEQQNRRILTFA